MYLLQPEWNWRWTILRDFQYQDTLAISTLVGILINFGIGNRLGGAALQSYAALLAFLALAYVSATQTINVTASYFYLNLLWRAILMAVIAAVLLDTRAKITAMIWTLVICQGYNALQITLQYYENGYSFYVKQQWGDFGSNPYSLLTLPILAFTCSLVVYSKRFWQRALAGAICVVQIHQIMLLDSRGCMLAGIFMAFVFFLNMPKSKNAMLGVAALVMAGVILAGPSVVEEFSSSFVKGTELDKSAQSRFMLWETGWQITVENPLLGVGPDAGKFLVPGYWEGSHREGESKALHNLFYEISTGCGLPAAVLYVAHFLIIWLAIVRLRWMKQKISARDHPLGMPMLAVISGQAGYWLASMFSSAALIESTYVSIAIGAATVCVHRKMYPSAQRNTTTTQAVGSASEDVGPQVAFNKNA